MKTVIHKANTRGHADHGWLNAHHTFSFANYYNPERIHFGALRVLNDDEIAPAKGFGTHPHDNMEIITIPLSGDLEHQDNMGNKEVIRQGDIQVMSAGAGIFHSEYNPNDNKALKLLQIWVFPNKKNVQPRYDQMPIREVAKPNTFYQILSPKSEDQGVWIHQNAWFHLGDLDAGTQEKYTLKEPKNGVYAFVIDGEILIEEDELNTRDGMGIWETENFTVKAKTKAKVLLMEIPMQA